MKAVACPSPGGREYRQFLGCLNSGISPLVVVWRSLGRRPTVSRPSWSWPSRTGRGAALPARGAARSWSRAVMELPLPMPSRECGIRIRSKSLPKGSDDAAIGGANVARGADLVGNAGGLPAHPAGPGRPAPAPSRPWVADLPGDGRGASRDQLQPVMRPDDPREECLAETARRISTGRHEKMRLLARRLFCSASSSHSPHIDDQAGAASNDRRRCNRYPPS